MGFSILDAHPNNECVDMDSNEAWFSFIFCGSHMDKLGLHVYDYYSGEEVLSGEAAYETVPVIDPALKMWKGVGNGVRVNIKDIVKDSTVFSSDGEYTWRAELIQDIKNIDIANGTYPDNMVYEGVLPGDPNFYVMVDNIQNFDYDHYVPLTPNYKDRIKPPYYVDFFDEKYERTAYDIPVTFDKVQTKNDGTQYTAIQVDTYTSMSNNSKSILRPAVGSEVLVHKKAYYGAERMYGYGGDDGVYIDDKIASLNVNDDTDDVHEGCYIKVGRKYYKIYSYDKNTGLLKCQNGSEIRNYPAGTHYAIYTTRFWTPYYYFRVHSMPKLIVDSEFHERRRLRAEEYDTNINSLENTFNGILFKAYLSGDSHSAVKYHFWEIYDESKLVYKTDKVYSQDMDCEIFVPFGHTYRGKITVVTQDGITVRGETEYYLPISPKENNDRFMLAAQLNPFGGVELAWRYIYYYDNSSLLKATDYEVFRVDQTTKQTKYLGKVDCSPVKITGAKPALTGANWYLFDKNCKFNLKTPPGAKVNMYLVGGGCDGGGWTSSPNALNKSFALPQGGGEGGYAIKETIKSSSGMLQCEAKVAERNDTKGTSLKIGGSTYRCTDSGCIKTGKVEGSTMTQTAGASTVYGAAENGADGLITPYGYVGSSGGGGSACGGNRSSGGVNALSVSGITPKYNKGNWLLIDRSCFDNGQGSFTLNVPEGTTLRMYLVGGGSDGGHFEEYVPDASWDVNSSIYYKGGGGGYVLEKELTVSGAVECSAIIADVNDNAGTTAIIGSQAFNCNDVGCFKTNDTDGAIASKTRVTERYEDGENGQDGIETFYGFVGSSGGGAGADNNKRNMPAGKGGAGAGDGGNWDGKTAHAGADAINYGCGGGGGALKIFDYKIKGEVSRAKPGKGMSGCIIFEIASVADAVCPEPGIGGAGAGDGGYPGENGDSATNYGCGGGGSGYYAIDSDGNVKYGKEGVGKGGCIILEIDLSEAEEDPDSQVYVVDWTASSDKTYRYYVTGCNYESAYLGVDSEGNEIRHSPLDMIECMAVVEITPHFDDFYLYFLSDADILCKTEYSIENYDAPLTEPMGRYIDSRNNLYTMVKRHMHTLALERVSKAFYRNHTWRVEGDVSIDTVTHNIVKNVSPLYAKMPAVTIQPSDYDSFSVSFLFGYLNCENEKGSGFEFNDQYMFELWKKCVAERATIMIKDPKGNIWTGSISGHQYKVEYDINGMPYIITFDFVQTRTENNTLVAIVDDNNKYLRTVTDNHLQSDRSEEN